MLLVFGEPSYPVFLILLRLCQSHDTTPPKKNQATWFIGWCLSRASMWRLRCSLSWQSVCSPSLMIRGCISTFGFFARSEDKVTCGDSVYIKTDWKLCLCCTTATGSFDWAYFCWSYPTNAETLAEPAKQCSLCLVLIQFYFQAKHFCKQWIIQYKLCMLLEGMF